MRVRFALTAYLFVIVASWLPYVALRIYLEYLTRTVPGASHGEFSGARSLLPSPPSVFCSRGNRSCHCGLGDCDTLRPGSNWPVSNWRQLLPRP